MSHLLRLYSYVVFRVKNTDFGDQAVALDEKYEATEEEYRAWHAMLKDNGVKIVAPPMWMRKWLVSFFMQHDISAKLTV